MTEPTSESHPPQDPSDQAGDQLVITSPDESTTAKDFLLWAGVIVLVTLTIYSPAIRGSFIWDDDRHVELNRNLHDAEGLANIWTKFGLRNGGTPQYYPVTHTTFWLEYQLSGATPNNIDPTIFHVTNVILHAGGAILLWFILRELAVPGAWVIAAIFAFHPIETESVAWISERKNVLSGALFFGAIYAYLRSGFAMLRDDQLQPAKRDWNLWGASLILFVLALLSKSVACSMPAVMLVLIWWKRGRITMRDVVPLIPFFVLGVAMSAVTAYVEREQVIKTAAGVIGPEWSLSPAQRILIAGRAVWFYAFKLVFPAKLTFIYPKWTVDPAQPAQWVCPIAAIVALLMLFLLRKRIGRGAFAAAAIFVGVLVPALGFFDVFPMRYSYVADHFQYLAGPALVALIVAAVARFMPRRAAGETGKANPLPYVISGIVLVVLAAMTLLQSRIYASQLALWRDTTAKNPDSWMVQNNYGVALFTEAMNLPADRTAEASAMLDDAISHFRRAIEIKPDHDRAYLMWGRALDVQNKPAEAMEKIQQAISINPQNVDALTMRGELQRQAKQPDAAAESFRQALVAAEAQRASYSDTTIGLLHQKIAAIALEKNDLATAEKELEAAMKLASNSGRVFNEYGKLMARKGEKARAAEAFARAIQLAPDVMEPHLELALLRLSVGNLAGSRDELRVAMRINPNDPRLMDAAKKWSNAYESSTRPSTTRSTTTGASTNPATNRATSAPATRP